MKVRGKRGISEVAKALGASRQVLHPSLIIKNLDDPKKLPKLPSYLAFHPKKVLL
jgi:hypothetical protein